jgi:diguanylate cyclase (GGDEF)-like protein
MAAMKESVTEKELQSLIYTDELTGLRNLRYLREQIPAYLEDARVHNTDIALFMLDIDNFKSINDQFGHLIGDKALIHFSNLLRTKVRPDDIIIRYAGDEFIILAPKPNKNSARKLGEEFLAVLQENPVHTEIQSISLKCSIGIAQFPRDGENFKTLFEKADEALYVAKDRGKNKVVLTPDQGRFLTPAKLNSILESPLIVGRDDLLNFLAKHLSKQNESPAFPIFLGPEGTGKTRLLKFAYEHAHENLDFVLMTKGYPFWQSDLYGAVFTALGNVFEAKRSISDSIFSRLDNKYKLILKPHIPAWQLKSSGDVEDKIHKTHSVSLFEALTQVFFLLRERGNGAVLLDDVDQMDTPSLQFFGSQFGNRQGGNLYFAASIRSPDLATSEEKLLSLFESMPELTTGGDIKKFQLESLREGDIRQFVAEQFNGMALPEKAFKTLTHNSAGSPLFLVEALSSLLLRGKILVEEDQWDLSEVKPSDIPTSLTEMIKERLLLLDEEVVSILKIASILGEKIQLHQLAELSKLKPQQVLNALSDAQRALLIEECLTPEEYVFSHRTSRSVLYSLLDEKERDEYHLQAAEMEQRLAVQSPERIVGKLAYHFHNAGKLAEAVEMFSSLKKQMAAVHISQGTREILQKRIHSVSLAAESPLESDDLSEALMIGKTFRSVLQNLRLYPRENENVKSSLQQFMNHLNPFLKTKTEALAISVTPETMIFNGFPLPPYLEDMKLNQDLYTTFNSYGMQGILFLRGLSEEELLNFLELFKGLPEDVINQWDRLLEKLNIAHVFPDRKIFVAVGEREVVLGDGGLVAQTDIPAQPGLSPHPTSGTTQMSDELLDRLRGLLDQFTKEKQELLKAIRTSSIDEEGIRNLQKILSQSKIEKLAESLSQSALIQTRPEPVPSVGGKYAEIKPDVEFVDNFGTDISAAFEDLFSEDTKIQAKAASWLTGQETVKLTEAAFEVITSDIPYKFRRLVAGVIKKAGPNAVEIFLKRINAGMHTAHLIKILRVCDVFKNNPVLVPLLEEIALRGPVDMIPPVVNVLKQVSGDNSDKTLLKIFKRASGKAQWDIIPMIADRKLDRAVPFLLEFIRPAKKWEQEIRISLQEDVCRTLGVLRNLQATQALIEATKIRGVRSVYKSKPESIRATATWALTQLPAEESVDGILEELKNDRSYQVRKAAELADIYRE